MAENTYREIKKKLNKDLEPRRYEHTLGVADTSFCMALIFGADPDKAYMAGLLHDCAKCMDVNKQKEIIKKYKVKLSSSESSNPSLVHAKLGVVVAREKYGVQDEAVLNAIRFHTTGKEDMSLLEKIVFSADYVEPGRKMIPGLDEIRKVIFTDLDRAVYMILENTVEHLKTRDQVIDDTTDKAYYFYKNLIENR